MHLTEQQSALEEVRGHDFAADLGVLRGSEIPFTTAAIRTPTRMLEIVTYCGQTACDRALQSHKVNLKEVVDPDSGYRLSYKSWVCPLSLANNTPPTSEIEFLIMIRGLMDFWQKSCQSYQPNGSWWPVAFRITGGSRSRRARAGERLPDQVGKPSQSELERMIMGGQVAEPRSARKGRVVSKIEEPTLRFEVAFADVNRASWTDKWKDRTGLDGSPYATVVKTGRFQDLPRQVKLKHKACVVLIESFEKAASRNRELVKFGGISKGRVLGIRELLQEGHTAESAATISSSSLAVVQRVERELLAPPVPAKPVRKRRTRRKKEVVHAAKEESNPVENGGRA